MFQIKDLAGPATSAPEQRVRLGKTDGALNKRQHSDVLTLTLSVWWRLLRAAMPP